MNRKRIAVIASGHEWSLVPVVRELSKNNTVLGFFTNTRTLSTTSKGLSDFYLIPDPYEKRFSEYLLYMLYKTKIDSLICLSEEIKRVVVKNKIKYKNFSFALPSFNSYSIALEKNKSIRVVSNLGVPVPKLYEYENVEDLTKLNKEFPQKIVVKGNRGVSSLNVRYVTTFLELEKAIVELNLIEKDMSFSSSKPLVQQYLGGPTYLTQALCQKGKVKSLISHVKIREWPVTGGVTCFGRTIIEPKLVDYATRILEKLEWHGEAGLEWKYCKEKDDFYFIEINPRFEGSLDLAIRSGVNYPKLLLKIIDNEDLRSEYYYRPNTYYRWFFRLDFKHFLYKPYGLSRFFWESINPNIKGELTLDNMNLLKGIWKLPISTLVRYLKHANS